MTPVFLKGILAGLAIAVPIGPICIYTFRQYLAYGFVVGLMAGLGASSADAILSVLAAIISQSAIYGFARHYDDLFHILGGGLLLFIGWRIFSSTLKMHEAHGLEAQQRSLGSYLKTLTLTCLSPMTLLLFVVMFKEFEVFEACTTYDNIAFVALGVFVGSASWWVTLGGIAHFLRNTITQKVFDRINKAAGFAIMLFGVWAIVSGLLTDAVDLLPPPQEAPAAQTCAVS